MLEKLGVTAWHEKGYKGQGVNVWIAEGDTVHRADVEYNLLQVAPEATVHRGSISMIMKSNKLVEEPKVNLDNGKTEFMGEFIKSRNIHIATNSQTGTEKDAWTEYIHQLKKETGILLFNSACNDGLGDGDTIRTTFPRSESFVVGAVEYSESKGFYRASYSAVGPDIDFMTSPLKWAGTSGASPVLAGMAALIIQRYAGMTETELYNYFKMITQDLHTDGFDHYTGWGIPVLPDPSYVYTRPSVEPPIEEPPIEPPVEQPQVVDTSKVMTSQEFVRRLKNVATEHKTLYIKGCFGAPMNARNKKRYSTNNSYNRNRATMINAASADTFGFDCICLLKGLLWGWNGDKNRVYGGAAYKSNGVPDISEDTMIARCSEVSTDFSNVPVGAMLWLKGHCGVYIGNGLAVECTPKWKNGVQITAVGNIGDKTGYNTRTWAKHGKLPYIDYKEEPITVYKVQIAFKGSAGGLINRLKAAGFNVIG